MKLAAAARFNNKERDELKIKISLLMAAVLVSIIAIIIGYSVAASNTGGTHDNEFIPSATGNIEVDESPLAQNMMDGVTGGQGHKFVDVVAGNCFILALRDDNTVWTWGRMYHEILNGDNSKYFRDQPTPVQVPISDVVAISVGRASHALKKDGTVWSWGSPNEAGDLGDGTTIGTNSTSINVVQVKDLDHIVAISGELALRDDGTVWAWGCNCAGDLGDGTIENRLTPVQVKGLTNITAIDGGAFAIKDDGTVWTWGLTLLTPDSTGHVYNDNYSTTQALCKPIPFQVPGLKNIKSIDTDYGTHTVFVKDDGTVWAWGYNEFGQLGDGTMDYTIGPYIDVPMQVKGINNVSKVGTAFLSSMALKDDGMVWAWGHNGCGQLGTGETGNAYALPVKVEGLKDVADISSHHGNSAFLLKDGSIWVCGWGDSGQNGNSLIVPSPAGESRVIDTPVKVVGGAVGGLAITAAAYIFIKFSLIGTVARAKSKLDKNDNRNLVLKYIESNPGATMSELSRAMYMNQGTLRYHLFILSLNHRIVALKSDSKYVRYFPNSGSYSRQEQLIISYMKRDTTKRMLGILKERSGLTNSELSKELKMHDSAISRYVKELVTSGVLEKTETPEGKSKYSINNNYKKLIDIITNKTI
jgi:alpha-tubulin suppressor-like RCC1 family protein/predicted transcriptional regulator